MNQTLHTAIGVGVIPVGSVVVALVAGRLVRGRERARGGEGRAWSAGWLAALGIAAGAAGSAAWLDGWSGWWPAAAVKRLPVLIAAAGAAAAVVGLLDHLTARAAGRGRIGARAGLEISAWAVRLGAAGLVAWGLAGFKLGEFFWGTPTGYWWLAGWAAVLAGVWWAVGWAMGPDRDRPIGAMGLVALAAAIGVGAPGYVFHFSRMLGEVGGGLALATGVAGLIALRWRGLAGPAAAGSASVAAGGLWIAMREANDPALGLASLSLLMAAVLSVCAAHLPGLRETRVVRWLVVVGAAVLLAAVATALPAPGYLESLNAGSEYGY